ncbi:gap junction -like protein [Labeo rohita]|uniref:Gap junction Cx32.2 protein n=2 Tax=Labeo rohita TaxID=84645 RepID=A0ABQ8LNE2_LABRO|nr:gap junction Cx32.2 protein [Labeo rohita]KAI2652192.1 Gap junction Cx32.2 protein [Labeo rohita]RXN10100.1 gap junction -like protein [Labeo rohita]
MGDWGFLSALLDKVQSHSTVIGKIWMSVLFIFRILVLGAGAENVWGDERSNLVCNTNTPGCENVCYDWKFPISHIRFWVMQIIFISTPTLVYLGHVVHVIHQENKLREEQKRNPMSKSPKYTNEQGKVAIKGTMLGSYLAQLFIKIILEVAFIVGQYFLFGFIMDRRFHCPKILPCMMETECFVSRPTEKTIFIIFMLVVACVSLALNVLEIFYLLCKRISGRNKKYRNVMYAGDSRYPSHYSVELDSVNGMRHNELNMAFQNRLGQRKISLDGAKPEA